MEEERTDPCRCQPWALDVGHYAELKTLKDLSAKSHVLSFSFHRSSPGSFGACSLCCRSWFCAFAGVAVSEQQCPEQPDTFQLPEGEGPQLTAAAPSLPLSRVSAELGWEEA